MGSRNTKEPIIINGTQVVEIQNTPADTADIKKQLIKPIQSDRYHKAFTIYSDDNRSQKQKDLIQITGNGLFDAFYAAYCLHGEVEISADDISLAMSHTTAQFINSYPEKCRHYFVEHEGKKELSIQIDGASKDFENFPNQNNNWKLTMELLAEEVNKNTKKQLIDTMGCDYSSTQSIERAAGNILILATTQKYFDFKVYLCGCGIQKVHYRGGKEDFEKLKKKIIQMRKDYPIHPDYVEYLEKLEWVVSEMINSMEGKINKGFWAKIFQEKNGVGYRGSGVKIQILKITGWFKYFFGSQDLQKDLIQKINSGAPVKIKDCIRNLEHQFIYSTECGGMEEISPNVFKPITFINVSIKRPLIK